MKIAYLRVSKQDQNLDLQRDALTRAGCERFFEEKASGAKDDRPELAEAIKFARKGDCLCVWRLDRLGRSLSHLIATVKDLESRGIGFESVTESINTQTDGGKLVFHIFGALAEFERSLVVSRTKAGLEAARARGRVGGRKPVIDKKKGELIASLYDSKKHSIKEICQTAKVSRATVYRFLEQRKAA